MVIKLYLHYLCDKLDCRLLYFQMIFIIYYTKYISIFFLTSDSCHVSSHVTRLLISWALARQEKGELRNVSGRGPAVLSLDLKAGLWLRGRALLLLAVYCRFHEARFCRGAQVRYQETEKTHISAWASSAFVCLFWTHTMMERIMLLKKKKKKTQPPKTITALTCALWITLWSFLTYKSGISENMV